MYFGILFDLNLFHQKEVDFYFVFGGWLQKVNHFKGITSFNANNTNVTPRYDSARRHTIEKVNQTITVGIVSTLLDLKAF